MKPIIPILIVTTAALAVTSVQFARQAAAQRERADSEKTLRQAQDARVAQLERELASARGVTSAAPSASTAQSETSASVKSPQMAPLPTERADRLVSNSNSPVSAPGSQGVAMSTRPVSILDTEPGRKYMQSMVKSNTRRTYADVGTALGLSEEKANQLLDLLGEQQARHLVTQSSDNGMIFAQSEDSAERQQKEKAEIAAVLGDDKMDQWAAYQKTLPDRVAAYSIDQQMQQAGTPLTDGQRSELRAAITEVSQRMPRPNLTGLPREEMMAQAISWQSDYDAAMLDSVKSVLSSKQFAFYKEQLDMQAAMRKAFTQQQQAQGK